MSLTPISAVYFFSAIVLSKLDQFITNLTTWAFVQCAYTLWCVENIAFVLINVHH